MIFHSEKQSIHQTFSIFNKTISFLMLILFISLTGCGSGESNISLGNRTGILYWGNGTEPASLDPHIATGVPEHHIMSSVMEGLVPWRGLQIIVAREPKRATVEASAAIIRGLTIKCNRSSI